MALLHLFIVLSDSGRVETQVACNADGMNSLLHIMPDYPLFCRGAGCHGESELEEKVV